VRGRSLIAVVCAVATLALPQTAAADAGSLYTGPGPRPGPDILYADPPRAPQLENTGIWRAAPILVSGTTAYREGEFLYQDYLYDDHGARFTRDPNDPRASGFGGDLFSQPNGTYTYPTAEVYASNLADLVELRVKPLADATAFRLTMNTMTDPSLLGTTIAIGDSPVTRALPHGANVSAPAQYFLTVHGGTVELVDAVTQAAITPAPTVSYDMQRRQIELRVPHAAWDPGTSTVRLAAATGLWDKATDTFLLPQGSATDSKPGGAGANPAPAAFFNVAFRTAEPFPSNADNNTGPGWWRDKQQGQALAAGDLSGIFANVDFGKLAAGTDDDSGVPKDGPMDRILASRFETKQGAEFVKERCQEDTLPEACLGTLRGQLQPYAIYVPKKPQPAQGYGLTLLLHSLSAGYNQYLGSRNQSQIGERGSGSIVITPAGRGPDGWYYDHAGADTFEVWADVARRFKLDAEWTAISGYSMGGYGTFKLAAQFPDLFARAQTTVGPPGVGIWTPPVAEPAPGGRSSNTNYMLESVRNIPFLMWYASGDELVPVASARAQQARFDALGLRYVWNLFSPAEHVTLAVNDQYQPAADFLGSAEVERDPAHVSYVVNPKMDFPGASFVADHAYWLSGLRLRDARGDAPRGVIDVTSEGFGVGDPEPGATQSKAGALTGGQLPALAYTEQSKAWGEAPRAPRRNRLNIDAENVRSVTINPARARVRCDAELNVASDGPITVTLSGCNRAVRFRPRCVAARQKVSSRGIGRVRIGRSKSRVRKSAGTPSRQKRNVYRYCVKGGGRVLVVFSKQGRSRLIITTARGHKVRGVRSGTTVERFRRAFRAAPRAGRGLYLTSRRSHVVIGTRKGRVRFVAVADRRLANSARQLRSHLRQAGF
jgi:C-terminal binding-module, SLH-like, of glucodextranase